MFCGTATTIVSGAAAERLKFNAYMLLAVFLSGFIYPLYGHWSWNGIAADNAGGWLENLGFVDFAGSTVVHSVGAWFGLAVVLVMGRARGALGAKDNLNRFRERIFPFRCWGRCCSGLAGLALTAAAPWR
jgi:Amt family ammonium transporter